MVRVQGKRDHGRDDLLPNRGECPADGVRGVGVSGVGVEEVSEEVHGVQTTTEDRLRRK